MKTTLTVAFFWATLNLFGQQKKIEAFPIEKSVSNMHLQDPHTTTSVFGPDAWNKHFEADDMFPRVECVNINKTQGLRLFFHYGGTKNAVAEFEIFLVNKDYRKPDKAIQLKVDEFKSGAGVSLGLSREEVISLLGKRYKSMKKNEEEEIVYYTDDPNSDVLKIYNEIAYFIKCRFRKGRLVKYNFGFEYP